MPENLQIYQFQSVNFTDTSSGSAPLTRAWAFSGGTPGTSTGITPSVVYSVPGQYTVTLAETDSEGTTATLVKTNLIQVSPSTLVAGISGPSPASVKMDQDYSLQDSTVGTPFPPTAWAWSLPYGRSASTQDVGATGYSDWYTLTGTYSGSPGSAYYGDIYLTASNAYLSSSASTTVTVSKLGPSEGLYVNATGANSVNYVTGITGGILTTSGGTGTPLEVNNFGYSSSNFVIKLGYLARGSTDKLNVYFHSTDEVSSVAMYTGLWGYGYIGNPADVIGGYLIIQGAIYSPAYSPIPADSAITSGNYVVTGQTTDFFLGDNSGLLYDLYTNYNYSSSLLSYLITNPYRIVHSGNIQYINTQIPTPISFVDTGGGSNSNPVVYSSQGLSSLGGPPPSNPIYEVYISAVIGGSPYGATASFGIAGSTGNDSTGNYYVAQNNSNGVGFVSLLNSAIGSSIVGGTGSLEFYADPIFSVYNGSGYDSTTYNGVALAIKNSTLVGSVTLSDNSYTLSMSYLFPTKIAPFTANSMNLQGSTETCSGIFSDTITIMPGQIYNIMSFGGSIFV